ncbi:D-sedoheptulose-7-phosphate isomerase [Geotalea daltonii FRC-32]|uniref:Phosphoheptose isomerase n=1 Tax=Geotalea daltonii (strain DSM 22248 / JCM 15807 / FRC-32) TaxID=316067 RepID=GMHA_GEODF|nr:D-sedoheptulose 7-phosphate isomerase [Geotalea daltonii]B9M5R7.1 RecName: Full=Phosphoheptose isomerase; AltName: Full=Sedoheptulose 7-phosphate isomerase [Geotalea daltonii FRC-32]ACM21826.1 D-sedoheptulose-7-phosphate isomerase [Geotalea daltonii FRC-32]
MIEEIKSQIHSHQKVMESIGQELSPKIAAVVELLADALGNGKKLLVMGNGGSAADAQHLVAELVGRFKMERRGLPAIALTTDTSILTAIGNDYGFENIFSRQIEALARPGDVVVGISTSGTSKNVYKALLVADELGCRTIGLLGRDGGTIAEIVDVPITVPCDDTPRVQEGHITIIHILCDLLEKRLFGERR